MTAIRIGDLREPVLTEEQRALRDAFEARPVRLDPDELVAKARRSTGLHDLAEDDGVVDRLVAHVEAIDEDQGLTNLGRLTQRTRVVRLLENRLRLHELLRMRPEIHDIEVPSPMIVVGLPRSGTTHLVNLLAEDPRRRALPFWESQEPIPVPGEGPGPDGLDPRYVRRRAINELERSTAPLARNMHDRFPEAIEEEVELMDLDFGSYVLEWHARVPRWRDFYLHGDSDARYTYLRTILKALTYLRGPQTWVLKSPQHMEQLGPLTRVFPDAAIAFTHRDPVAVLQSAITMLAYGDRLRRHTIEPGKLADYWADRIEQLLRACVRDRELVPDEASLDIGFADFMADDLGTVERFYARAGVDLTDEVRRRFVAYLAANPRGKHGRVAYDLRGDFGVDPDELRQRYAFYTDRFDVREEEL